MMRMLIVEDHTIVRQAFRILLSDPKYGIEIVGEAGDGMEAIDLAQSLQPDVIVMDILLPRLDGVSATSAILQRQPAARILVLTSDENEATALAAIAAGALGFVRNALRPMSSCVPFWPWPPTTW